MKNKSNILSRTTLLCMIVITICTITAIGYIAIGSKREGLFRETVIVQNPDSITYTAIIDIPLRVYLPGTSSDSIIQGFTDDRLATFYDGKTLYVTALNDVPLRDESFDFFHILFAVLLTLTWIVIAVLFILLLLSIRREAKNGVLRRLTVRYAWSIAILCPFMWLLRQVDFLINAQSLKPILHGRYYGEISFRGDDILLLCILFVFAALFSYSRSLSEEQQYTV